MRRPFISILLIGLIVVFFAYPAVAATVGIDPPAAPVTVSTAELKLTIAFDAAAVTPPATIALTLIVTNIGAATATNVAIDNLLPTEFSYFNGDPADLKNLGDLVPGGTITKNISVSIPPTVATNRYVDEAIVSAANADSVEAIAAIDINNGQVLGASDENGEVLAVTGKSPIAIMLLGFLYLGLGGRIILGHRQ